MKGLYKLQDSRFWWFRWTQGGKRYAVSLKTDDEAVAIGKARECLAGHPHQTNSVLDINRLISQYIRVAQERGKKPMRPQTAKRVRYILLQFHRDNSINLVGDVTHESISDWLAVGRKHGWSDDTIHTYARALRSFINYLASLKLVRADAFKEFEVPQRRAVGRKNWVENSDCRRVIGEAKNPTLRFILYCGFHAGLRRSEICAARVHWFDVIRGLIHIQNDEGAGFVLKDRENRTVPLSAAFKEFLDTFLKGRERNEFAIEPDKNGAVGYRYDFRRIFASHMRRCGVRCTIHDMRRSFASNLVSQGESIYIVSKWLGDGVEVVDRSYGHLGPSAGNINRLV